MNMIAARRVSIVDPTPGVTRDRVMAIVELEGENPADSKIKAEFIDTGGYGVYTAEGRRVDNAGEDLAELTDDIEQQIGKAVESADIILFIIDAQAGVTAQDEEIAQLLREGGMGGEAGSAGDKVVVVANKVDGPRWEAHGLEGAALGFGAPLLVSAKNNYCRREFVESLYERVKPIVKRAKAHKRETGQGTGADAPAHAEMMLAIVGKRNAGKSTLVNALAGEKRVIVSEIAGTTRDAIDVRFELEGRSFVAIDTAGLRKKKSFQDRIEWYALDRMQLAIDRADVALLMIDATDSISQVDQQVAMMLAKSYKPVVIVVNKWDLARGRPIADGRGRKGKTGRSVQTGDYEEYLRAELKGLWYAPIAFISSTTRMNVRETIDLAFELYTQAHERTTTGKLNRLVRGLLDKTGPANKLGTFAKVLFVAQVAVSPPTIVCVVNRPELFTANYQRFLMNRFREQLPFPEVPIKLLIRGRRKDEDFKPGDEKILAAEVASGALGGQAATLDGREDFDHFTPAQIEAMFDESTKVDVDAMDEIDEPIITTAAARPAALARPFAPKRFAAAKGPARSKRGPVRRVDREKNTSAPRRKGRKAPMGKSGGKPSGGKRGAKSR